jgi:hypothetical protein
MSILDPKTIVERYEGQFQVKEMKNKHLFYDLYARVGDPEELRSFVHQLMQDMDWKTSIDELTKWEEEDTEGIYRGGRLKPIKTILKSHKEIIKGPKWPWVWKILAAVGIGFLAFYLYTVFNFEAQLRYSDIQNIVLAATPFWFLGAIMFYMIKEKVNMAIWAKIAGVYDVSSEEADVRIVLAADAEKADKQAFDKLEEDLSEMYNVLSRKYVKKKSLATATVHEIGKEIGTRGDPGVKILKAMAELDKQMADLNNQLATGKITESTFNNVKKEMEQRKTKLQTLVDLLSTG